jgi:hypothetical protein
MLGLGALLILAGAVLGWFTVLDRQSALALDIVEHTDAIPGLWAILVGLGVLLVGAEVVKRLSRRPEPEPPRRGRSTPAVRTAPASPRRVDLELPRGARLLLDQGGVPMTLMLEHVPAERARRAIEQLGAALAEGPVPPRLRIRFFQCPDMGTPRQHLVSGALAQRLPRSDFKATLHLDDVEVLFHHPGDWRERWGA